MDLNPIRHASPAKKIKSSFLDYIQLLMIGQTGWWTRTASDGLEPHLPPFLSSQKNLPKKKWNAHFWITFNFWWSAGLVDGLEPHLPPLSSQKNKMLIFGLRSTSDDRPGWLMDWNPICHRSPAKKIKCSFLDDFQLLLIARAGQWTWTPSATTLQPKKWNAHFWITFNFWWLAGLVHGLKPYPPHLPAKKMKCSFLDYVQFLVIGRVGQWTRTPSATPLQPKKWNAHFWITSTSDDRPGWSMDLNPICHHSPAKKIKCSFLDYVQLLMIGQAGWWTGTPSASVLQKMLIFGWFSTSGDRPGWSMDSNPICHHSPAKKIKCSFFGLRSTSDDRPGWSMDWTPSATPLQPNK